MMLYPAMNDLLKRVPSRYQLVNVVAARARQIASQAESQSLMLEDKPVSIAIREIAEGHLDESPFLKVEVKVEEPPLAAVTVTEEVEIVDGVREFFLPAD